MDIKIYFVKFLLQILLADFAFSAKAVYFDVENYIPKSKRMKAFVRVIKKHISKYNDIKSIDGLSALLKPVQHCPIHMTNFGGIDLPSLDVPTLQMQTKLTVCAGKVFAVSKSLYLRSNKTSLTCIIEIQRGVEASKCPLSHLFADSTRLCVELNFRKFVTRVRPWTCEAVVSFFPKLVPIPNRSYRYHEKVQIQKTVSVFDQDNDSPHHRYILRLLPSYAPINILVTQLTNDSAKPQNWESPNGVGSWFKYSFTEPSKVTKGGEYAENHENSSCRVLPHVLKIEIERSVSQGTICNTKSYTQETRPNGNYFKFLGRPDLAPLDNKFYPTAVSHPLTFEDSRRTIGFIACGSGEIQNLAFRELFCVFDGYVWACLFTINLVIIPVLWCVIDWLSEKNKSKQTAQHSGQQSVFSSRIFFQAVVILLEQGNAFTNKHLNAEAKRWIASALILAAIVLTNSYKYD
ncbi:unnamed protein product [Orchesella dallaii]|uniref:Uncharacterized protein n=1 Tax=Orchesella dallaii TaxID=48710 RepID=A0ABP1S920_9HEXA